MDTLSIALSDFAVISINTMFYLFGGRVALTMSGELLLTTAEQSGIFRFDPYKEEWFDAGQMIRFEQVLFKF